MMTDEQLDELERLAKAATPGQWFYDGYSRVWTDDPAIEAADDALTEKSTRQENYDAERVVCYVPAFAGDTALGRQAADASYIEKTQPREILKLIAEVRQLRAELDKFHHAADQELHRCRNFLSGLEPTRGAQPNFMWDALSAIEMGLTEVVEPDEFERRLRAVGVKKEMDE